MSKTDQTEAAKALMKSVDYATFVRALFNRSGDASKDFTHAILGIVTEIKELRQAREGVNLIEELGDLCFYVQALQQVCSDYLGMNELTEEQSKQFYGYLTQAVEGWHGPIGSHIDDVSNELLDCAKRWVGYNKVPPNLMKNFADAAYLVDLAMREVGSEFGMDDIQLVNVAKLLERYNGMQFNAERAVNRDLGSERKVLERAVASDLV